MANTRNSNTFYVDTTSSSGTAASYIAAKNLRIKGITFHMAVTTDVIDVHDKATGSAAAGTLKLKIRASTALNTQHFDFSDSPLVCPNGLWVVLTGSPICTVILDTTSV